MCRLFITFLLIVQPFLLFASATGIYYSAQNFNKHTEYIQTQTLPQKKISVDFKNYENAVLSLGSKTEEMFSCKDNRNFGGLFIGFSNYEFNQNFKNQKVTKKYIFSEFHNISSVLKNEVHTRAP